MRITKADLDVDGFYKEDGIDTTENIEVEPNLGIVQFKKSVRTTRSLLFKNCSLEVGESAKIGGSLEVGESAKIGGYLEVGESAKIGGYLKVDEGIIVFLYGVGAKTVSCLRIAVGFNNPKSQKIEAKIVKGNVVLGEIMAPNPLPPKEYAWHIHHEKLFEALTEPIENRTAYIQTYKPKEEVETRLRLLHKVKDIKALKRALTTNNYKAIEALHKKECPDCPWNGKTIFPNEKVT